MKRLHILPSLFLLAAGCAKGPVGDPSAPGSRSGDDASVPPAVAEPAPTPPGAPSGSDGFVWPAFGSPTPLGGQSGDDGSVPAPLGCTSEGTVLGPDQATVFGASARELLARIAPAASSPLFWVPYDAHDVGTFTPGPGQTSLTLQITLGTQPVIQGVHIRGTPAGYYDGCGPSVTLPVHVALSTADGALTGSFDTQVVFGGAIGSVDLSGQIAADALTGSFAFDQQSVAASELKFLGFKVDLQLWPGGSRGTIVPSFDWLVPMATSCSTPCPPYGPMGPVMSDVDAIPIPAVPDHWNSVAVWPRRETCEAPYGSEHENIAYAATDDVLGSSFVDVVTALNDRGERRLETSNGPVPVRFALDEPSGLLCASVSSSTLSPSSIFNRAVQFRIPGHLAAGGSGVSAELSHLAIGSNYDLTAEATLDGPGLDLLRWVSVGAAQNGADLMAATGLELDIPSQYEELQWTWYGTDRRDAVTSPWSTQASFVVSGFTQEQVEQAANDHPSGLPSPPLDGAYDVDQDGNVTLAGDTLLNADITE